MKQNLPKRLAIKISKHEPKIGSHSLDKCVYLLYLSIYQKRYAFTISNGLVEKSPGIYTYMYIFTAISIHTPIRYLYKYLTILIIGTSLCILTLHIIFRL